MERSIEELIAEEVGLLGFELIKLETIMRGRKKLLRIYIDHPERNVTIDDCVQVSKALGFVLDSEERFPGPYNLEVSSPGIDRPLTKWGHFARFAGKNARVEYRVEGGGRNTVIGKIIDSNEERVTIGVAGEHRSIGMDRILKANLHGEEWDIPHRKSARRKARKKRTK
jgi:ribosome maturation factor RimP